MTETIDGGQLRRLPSVRSHDPICIGREVSVFLPPRFENFHYTAFAFVFKTSNFLLRVSQVKHPEGLNSDHSCNVQTAGIHFKFSDNVCTKYLYKAYTPNFWLRILFQKYSGRLLASSTEWYSDNFMSLLFHIRIPIINLLYPYCVLPELILGTDSHGPYLRQLF
jgi:hypothetical protein